MPTMEALHGHSHHNEVQDKLLRAGGFAVEGAKRAAPLLSLPWALGVRAVVPWRGPQIVARFSLRANH